MSSELLANLGRGAIGMFFLIFVCYLLSNNRKAINWKLVIIGLVAMICFYLGVVKVDFINAFFNFLSRAFVRMINVEIESTRLIFGNLIEERYENSWGFIFAVRVLPTIIFFSALSAILYYTGILQKVVYVFAWLLSKLRISGAESVSTAANIFMGQTEAPLMIKPYLDKMNRSEILLIMIGGMANTAGSVLGAYVSFLGAKAGNPEFFAMHLLTQSLLSAPAAIIVSKILFPQTQVVDTSVDIPKQKLGDNFLDALSIGTTDGLKLAVNVAAMLIAFTALIFVLNYLLFKVGDWTNLNQVLAANTPYDRLSFQMILGYIFSPVAWLIGVRSEDMLNIGQLLGEKTILNEFNAYLSFSGMLNEGRITDPKSILITTYALSGFANFASIGIQIGGISQLAPNQRRNLTELGFRALIGGTIACLMCGCIAGALYG